MEKLIAFQNCCFVFAIYPQCLVSPANFKQYENLSAIIIQIPIVCDHLIRSLSPQKDLLGTKKLLSTMCY